MLENEIKFFKTLDKTFLVTQSLLSAWLYIDEAYDECKETAYNDFLRTLHRTQTAETKAIKRGREFENRIREYTLGKEKSYSKEEKEIGERMKGAQYQVSVSKYMKLDGYTFNLYGKADFMKEGIIYDLKRVSNYDVGKYLNSPQHPLYLECVPKAKRFEYIIFDGSDISVEIYTRQNTMDIRDYIRRFMQYLKEANLLDIYLQKWWC